LAIHIISDTEMYDRIRLGCRDKRTAIGLSQSELAQKAGVALRTVKNFELGSQISLLSLMKLMRALGEFNRFESLVPTVEASPREQFLHAKAAGRSPRGKN